MARTFEIIFTSELSVQPMRSYAATEDEAVGWAKHAVESIGFDRARVYDSKGEALFIDARTEQRARMKPQRALAANVQTRNEASA